jgi:hypothetical protein
MFSRLFSVEGKHILGMYTTNEGVVCAEPSGTEHLAHVRWTNPFSGKPQNIDYFLAPENIEHSDWMPISGGMPAGLERKYGMDYSIISGFREMESTLRKVAVRDIKDYLERAGENERQLGLFEGENYRAVCVAAKKKEVRTEERDARVEYVTAFSSPSITYSRNYAKVDVTGKQDYYPGCILDLNLDFANWCMSGITPDGKLAPWNSCEYCYSAHTHKGYPEVYCVDKQDMVEQIDYAKRVREEQGKKTRFLRFGKRTEAGAGIFRRQLVASLEACIDTGIRTILPSKFLEYNREVAALLQRSDSTLLVSLGSDELERGAVLHGRTQEARLESARHYLEAGVRVVPYVLIDAALPNGGSLFEKNFNEVTKGDEFAKVQLIPLRLRHSKKAKRMIGGWHSIVHSENEHMFGCSSGAYCVGNDGTRIPEVMDKSIIDLVGDNRGRVRMCSHSPRAEYCGMCFMPGMKGFARRI